MKKNSLFEARKKKIPLEVKKQVDLSFAIVDRICDIMEQQGLSQKDLAQKMGKTEAEISKWMRGTHNFTIATISKLEMVLGENILVVPSKEEKINCPVLHCIDIPYNKSYETEIVTSRKSQKNFGSIFSASYLN